MREDQLSNARCTECKERIPYGVMIRERAGKRLCPECFKKLHPKECKALMKVRTVKCDQCNGTGKHKVFEGECYKCGQNHDPEDRWCPPDELPRGCDE